MKKPGLFILVVLSLICASEYEGLLFPSRHVVLSTLSSGVIIELPICEGQKISKDHLICKQDQIKDSLNLVLSRRKLERSKIEKTNELECEVALKLQETAYAEKQILAPFSGTIIKVTAKENEYYSTGSKIIELADLSSLMTEIHVSKTDLDKILSGKVKIFVSKNGQDVNGTFSSHNPIAEPGVESFLVKIKFTNKFNWPAGTGVKVIF